MTFCFSGEFIQLKGSQHKERTPFIQIHCLPLLNSGLIHKAQHFRPHRSGCARRNSDNRILACSYDDTIQPQKKILFHVVCLLLDTFPATVGSSINLSSWGPDPAHSAQTQNTLLVHRKGKKISEGSLEKYLCTEYNQSLSQNILFQIVLLSQ